MDQYFKQLRLFTQPSAPGLRPCPVISVGWAPRRESLGAAQPARLVDRAITHAAIDEVDAELLARTRAELVVSPVIARDFDCVDLVRRLCDLSFRGQCRSVALMPLDAALIEAEIAEICPGLDFRIVTPPETLRWAS